jgi:hypothetical protein
VASAFDCCGGKGKHLGGCYTGGSSGGKRKKDIVKKPLPDCTESWVDDDNDKIHRRHQCYQAQHTGRHRCICGNSH